jgi:hypothetical protein
MNQKSDARARGNNPRFSWWPSSTMLKYRLSGTTEGSVSNRNERTKYYEPSNFTLVRTNRGAPHNLPLSRRAANGFSTAEMEQTVIAHTQIV